LEEHRNRTKTIKNVQYRTQCYQIANNFISNIYQESLHKLITANAYPDNLNNFLHSEFLDDIVGKAYNLHQKIIQTSKSIEGVFEKDVIGSITEVAKKPKAARELAKKRL
jgi:hypothetical protein